MQFFFELISHISFHEFAKKIFPSHLLIKAMPSLKHFCCFIKLASLGIRGRSQTRECVSKGAAGARTRRSLGHHLSHPLILSTPLRTARISGLKS